MGMRTLAWAAARSTVAEAATPAIAAERTHAGQPYAPVLIVGAGPAGLATARELGERAVRCRVLERGPTPAHVWHNLYDSLRLHTGRHLSALPGLRFPRGTSLFPSRSEFTAYLERYRDTFDIDVATGTETFEGVTLRKLAFTFP